MLKVNQEFQLFPFIIIVKRIVITNQEPPLFLWSAIRVIVNLSSSSYSPCHVALVTISVHRLISLIQMFLH